MERADKTLLQKDIRITPMRQLLLEYFFEHAGALGLQELEEAFPKSDRITMYRTLKTFEEKGIVHGIHYGPGQAKYALCSDLCTPIQHVDQHPHFQCEQCKHVYCIDSLFIPKMELPKGFVQLEMTMMIKGICPKCRP